MRTVLCFLISTTITAASYCGQAAIPFTFQSLRSGQPVLGCARPKCFGWNANGTRAEDTARFYRINGKEDGYLRRSDAKTRVPFRADAQPLIAKCDQEYRSTSCGVGEWLGGIAAVASPLEAPLQIQCCSYALLQDTDDRGVAPIKPGQVYIGGEVLEGDKLVAFDYISDVAKRIYPNRTIMYEVSVRRMACAEEDSNDQAIAAMLDNDIRDRQDAINEMVPAVAAAPSPYGVQEQNQRIVQYGVQQQNQPAVYPNYHAVPQYQQQAGSLNAQLGAFGQQQTYVQQPYGQQHAYAPQSYGQQPQWFQSNVPQAPRPGQQQPMPLQQQQQVPTPMPSLPTITLPKLEDFPQFEIPSVEQVEEVIPPMQKAILTNIAKFFGVL